MTSNPAEYTRAVNDVDEVFDLTASLPQQVFKPWVRAVRVIDFAALWSRSFYEAARRLTVDTLGTGFSVLVLEPDPVKYFYAQFQSFPLVSFSVDEGSAKYIAAINEDPGDSPADAIIHNSDIVVMYSVGRGWCIYASRKWEIAIVAVRDAEVLNALSSGALQLRSMHEAIESGLVVAATDVPSARDVLLRNYSS